jgi:hypothetical protein
LFLLDTKIYGRIFYYNHERPRSGRYCYGKTPMETFADSKVLAKEKKPVQGRV